MFYIVKSACRAGKVLLYMQVAQTARMGSTKKMIGRRQRLEVCCEIGSALTCIFLRPWLRRSGVCRFDRMLGGSEGEGGLAIRDSDPRLETDKTAETA